MNQNTMKELIKKPILAFVSLLALTLAGCSDDDDGGIIPNAGTISGGPFNFVVDGVADNVSGLTIDNSNSAGTNSRWVITDDAGNILGLPPTLEALEDVNFDDAGVGVCLIWYIRYEDGLQGLEEEMNTSDLTGVFDLSNSITVNRNALAGATLTGGPFNFVVNGMADNVSGITVDESNVNGMNTTFVITDEDGEILGLPSTTTDLEGVDFDEAGGGVCFIYHLTYQDGLQGLSPGMNIDDLDMTGSAISNAITVYRLDAPTLTGGPFSFTVGDGMADNLADGDIVVEGGFAIDDMSRWVVTDDANNILGLPPTFTAVDFDDAGEGICFVWYITYAEGLQGLAMGNSLDDLVGTYELSNGVKVKRLIAPEISGGPFNFIVDGTADNIPMNGITIENTGTALDESGWVVTDDQGGILGLPPTFTAPDFDEAGPGVCLVWYINYDEGLAGLEMGMNANDLEGVYTLSNPITVNRLDAPILSGGPFTFTVGDGTPDTIAEGEITVEGGFSVNEMSGWVVTDDAGNILDLPTNITGVDFDGTGAGVCQAWYITYAEGLTGLQVGNNVSDLAGAVYELSNAIEVVREL